MNQDTIWQVIRYALIAGGGFLTGKGYFSTEQVTTIIGAIGTVFPIVWGLYAKHGTKSVTEKTAARSDVPTVSAATGVTEKS